jgi:hypothetical protein
MILSGCSVFTYDLTPPSVSTVASTHRGEDCGPIILGLGYGDLSVAQAMKNGGITTPSRIILKQSVVLIGGESCLVVHGDGPGVQKSQSPYQNYSR